MQTQTDFGQTLNLNVATQVMKINGVSSCFVKVSSGSNLIRKSFKGFGPESFKWADEQAQTVKLLTGADIIYHATNECDRNHPVGRNCNTKDSDLTIAEKSLR
jgi:hypothetical protein